MNGFKCIDCKSYIIPPQEYDHKEIKLCTCLEVETKKVDRPKSVKIVPRQNAIEMEEKAMRLQVADEARNEVLREFEPISVYIPKPPRKGVLSRLVSLLTV